MEHGKTSRAGRTRDSGSRKEGLQERPANEPRSGGTEVSPGREPWVDMATGQSRVATAQADGNNIRIVLAENERDLTLTDILGANPNPQALTLAVGPEGGWTPEELKLFAEFALALRLARRNHSPRRNRRHRGIGNRPC